MNFFKGKDPDVMEVSREKRVKECLIGELSSCLKNIQATQQARKPGEPIYTSDSSNYLCTILEAVFLHGHKSTRGIRHQADIKAFDRCSFWSFVQRFTHKDTISQLKRLTHIKTETGVCRAWIKLAINDGLMESYLTAILAQPSVLRQYYSRTALLRDLEQPDILLKLIKVLAAANYDFQLVYNSSQLNVWTMKALALAGLVERQFVFDGGKTVSANPSPNRSRSSTLDMDDLPFDFAPRKQKSDDSEKERHSNISSRRSSADQSDVFDRISEDSSVFPEHREDNSLHNITELADANGQLPVLDNSHSLPKARIHDELNTLGEEPEELLADEPKSRSSSKLSADSSVGGSGQLPSHNAQYDNVERELARLRTAQYSIGDIINMDSSVQRKDEEPAGELTNQKPTPDDITISALSNHVTAEVLESSNDHSKESSRNYAGTLAEDLADEQEDVYSNPSLQNHVVLEEPWANTDNQSEDVANDKIKFVIGTPQSQSELFPAVEEPEPDDGEGEEETFDSPYLREETIADNTNATSESVEESSYSKFPFSAAQAILNKRMSGAGSQASSVNKQTAVSGSLGSMSHGNSLASLTGWGNMEREETPTPRHNSVDMGHVPSFADLVSGQQQVAGESIGSPRRDYSAVSSAAKSAGEKKVPEDSQLEETESKLESAAASSRPPTPDADTEFEVVGNTDKDVLLHYGKLRSEQGLDAQDYKCESCAAPVGIIYGIPRVCAYTKKYYCLQCHVNEESSIPAKILYNWDFAKYKVCKSSKDFLTSAEQMPLLNINEFNKRLYYHVPALETSLLLRTQLFYLKRYLFACNPTVAEELKQRFWPREYLYEEIHTYTIQDLVSINSTSLLHNLMKKSIKFARKHIEDCESCEYRGFLCEICGSTKVIFPFDLDTTSTCDKCNGVYHKSCFTSDCPKCERIRQRDLLLGKSPDNNLLEEDTDFSMPHL